MNSFKQKNLLVGLGVVLFFIVIMFGYIKYDKNPGGKGGKVDPEIVEKFKAFSGEIIDSNVINFAGAMDRESVEANIEIFPVVETNLVWEDDKTLKIEVKDELEREVEFFVNINENAIDKIGNKLDSKIVQKFRVDGVAKIDFITPEGAITDMTKNITVRFSKPIVSLTTLDNQPDCPIVIIPEIPGKCVWITTSTFQFRPDEGFPIGAKYSVSVAKGIKTIAGDETINSKEIIITTPKFEILNTQSQGVKDKPMIVTFNAPISLENFKENFKIEGVFLSKMDIEYFKVDSTIKGEKIEKKNIISIFPKNKDWGYGKYYNYTLGKGLKSIRGNVPLGTDTSRSLRIEKLLTNYAGFIYRDKTSENKELSSNIRRSNSNYIINKINPKIILDFYEDVLLDKSLFTAVSYESKVIDFDIKYAKKFEEVDGEQAVVEDKKKIIVEFKTIEENSIYFKISTSKISISKDEILNLKTKSYNEVLDYKFINYKKSCLTLKNDIGRDRHNYDKFDFNDKYGKINYISLIYYSSKDEDCKYKEGKYTYVILGQLNPMTDYNLTIKKELLDGDNYPLGKEYNTSFKTKEALNEDKHVSVIDNREFILVPTDIKPLGVAIKSTNLDKVMVKICEGNFDITNINYLKNEFCENKEVSINNLGFNTNFSVLNLEEIFGREFSKSLVILSVEKIKNDKTKYELERSSDIRTSKFIHFLRTNTSIVLKSNKKTSLWLTDYKTGELFNNQIKKIERYNNKSEYSAFGKYIGNKKVFKNKVNFEFKKDGLYELSGDIKGYLLVTLNTGEEILFNSNDAYYNSAGIKTYLTTDRPIYKPGNKVKIKGIIRTETAKKYELITGTYNLIIRDSRYKEIINEEINLSPLGSMDYEFELENDASLGNYSILMGNDSISFTVEEFEKPDFKVESESDRDNYLYSEIPKVSIKADYYIGNPLSNGNGFYNIVADQYIFNGGKTTGYSWGENNNYWRYWDYNSSSNSTNIEYNKEFVLDKNGKVNIEIDTNKTSKDMVYNLSSTVIDPNTKKSISANTSFKVLNSPVFVGLKQDKYYYEFGDNVKLNFVTVDIEGEKVGKQKLNFRVYKIDYNYDKETFITKKDETLLTEKLLTTDKKGSIDTNYKINDYGEFRFEIELEDKKYKTTKTTYVSGFNLVRPTEQEHNLNIIKDKEKYDIGDTAEIIIQSPVTGVKALVTVEKLDEILFDEVITINSTTHVYKLPIKKEYLPNFDLKVFIIKTSNSSSKILEYLKNLRIEMIELEQKLYGDNRRNIIPLYVSYDIMYKGGFIPYYRKKEELDENLLIKLAGLKAKEQKLMQDIIPNYYTGNIPVKINLDSIELNSEVKTDKENYLPSDTSTIDLTILDNEGNPVNGEAVISVVDEALLALKNNDSDIVDFFYRDKPNYINTIFNMQDLIKRFEFNEQIEQIEEEKSDGEIKSIGNSLSFQSLGVDDAMVKENVMSDMSMMKNSTPSVAGSPNSNATKLRTEFKDSAYYNGVVKVINGKATVNIKKLPDNLTTWVVKGFAVTKDTKVGNFESTFKVKKTLNLLPSIPRFFVSGDEIEISAVVVNNSSKTFKIDPSIEITNVEIIKKPRNLVIPANGQKLIVWKIKVDAMKNDIDWNNYFSDITLKVISGDLQDSLKVSKKIIPYSTPEYTFTNGSTYGLSYEEKINLPFYVDKSQGQIDISYGATILTSLLDNVENIARMPLNNFYTTVSALKKGAILRGLYEKAGRLDEFKKITVIDYNGVEHKLEDIINLRINYLKDYQANDGGMMVYDDCFPNSWRQTCSNFSLTGEFLNMAKLLKDNGYIVDDNIVNKALNYYKNELEKQIEKHEENELIYRNISPFYEIIGYDKSFIKKYLLSERFTDTDYEFDNISKLKIILLLQEVDKNNKLITTYLKELKNKTIIEARGTLLPANNYRGNNIISTSLATRVFINSEETEKLIVENLTRWLLAQKRENGEFGSSYDSTEVLKAITSYIDYTKELENVNFEAKGYLNYKEITSEIFNDKNKFSLAQESFILKDYIEFGVDNSLGFEKTGTGKLYYDVGLRYFLPIEKIEARDEGIIVSRNYYNYLEYNEAFKEECIEPYWYGMGYRSYDSYRYCNKIKKKNIDSVAGGKKGEMLIGEIEIIVPSERNNVIINNFIPAGAEILNTNLDTTSSEVKVISGNTNTNWYSGFSHTEIKDDRVLLFADHLYEGSYKYTYVIKLNHKGKYHNRPAVAEELKKPEIWGRSKGEFFEIK